MKADKKTPIKERKWFKLLTNKYTIVTVIFVVIVLFIDNNNLITWGRLGIERMQQERIIRQYEQDIEDIESRLDELNSDRDSLEKFTREQFYFHEKDEDVFLVK